MHFLFPSFSFFLSVGALHGINMLIVQYDSTKLTERNDLETPTTKPINIVNKWKEKKHIYTQIHTKNERKKKENNNCHVKKLYMVQGTRISWNSWRNEWDEKMKIKTPCSCLNWLHTRTFLFTSFTYVLCVSVFFFSFDFFFFKFISGNASRCSTGNHISMSCDIINSTTIYKKKQEYTKLEWKRFINCYAMLGFIHSFSSRFSLKCIVIDRFYFENTKTYT